MSSTTRCDRNRYSPQRAQWNAEHERECCQRGRCRRSHEGAFGTGAGLLESAYEGCLAHELRKRGHQLDVQRTLPVVYDGVRIDVGYRIDLLVDDAVVVELKAVDKLSPIHEAQLLTYLKLSGKKVGLLINFNVLRLKDGIKRMVHNL